MVSNGALVVMKGYKKSIQLYILYGSTVIGDAAVSTSSLTDDEVTKLWYMRLGHMSENGMVELSKIGLLDGQKTSKIEFCEYCVFGKQKRVRFTKGRHNTKGTLEYIHSNLWGPAMIPYKGRYYYLLTAEGILRHLTMPGTPQQNGVAERMNRTLMEKGLCMLSNSGLPKSFWAEAATTPCFLVNHSPLVVIDKKTPEDV
ncbi:unnamed protein product [Fraxinus pennsylvanica]|uniref:Integrase catalytic domain-containing protein n=1 Tax=Fraxinus pennsylvanica TaxID=56036 RepID=A0AAD2ADW4_9LAMI|nr:unnamed protein product [Fraxinus pennsylvanica]